MTGALVPLSVLLTLVAAASRDARPGSLPAFIEPFSACVRSRGKDASYRGAIDVTESGHRCMNWSEVAGFEQRYPGRGIGAHSHCRNPDGRLKPWCFFRNPGGRLDWGYCDCKQGRITRRPCTLHQSKLASCAKWRYACALTFTCSVGSGLAHYYGGAEESRRHTGEAHLASRAANLAWTLAQPCRRLLEQQ